MTENLRFYFWLTILLITQLLIASCGLVAIDEKNLCRDHGGAIKLEDDILYCKDGQNWIM